MQIDVNSPRGFLFILFLSRKMSRTVLHIDQNGPPPFPYLLSQVPESVLMSSTAKPPLLACPFNMIVKGDLEPTANWAGVQVGSNESYPSAVIFHIFTWIGTISY
jgi:hypothetical protein